MDDKEKRFWLTFLREFSKGNGRAWCAAVGAEPRELSPDPDDEETQSELLSELADELEREWFQLKAGPGRKAKRDWSWFRKTEHNARAINYRVNVKVQIARMKERGESPRGGRRRAAIEKLAKIYGIEPDTLEKQMRLVKYPRH